jgi:hypothetical protein
MPLKNRSSIARTYLPSCITLFISYTPTSFNKYDLYTLSAVAQWLRYRATNRKVAGSIPDVVIGIFHWHNPSDRTMALVSTQPLTEMSTRSLPGGKGGRYVGLTTLPPSCAVVMKSGNRNFLEHSGPLQACNGTALPLPYTLSNCICNSLSFASISMNESKTSGLSRFVHWMLFCAHCFMFVSEQNNIPQLSFWHKFMK